jgi:hypothetical protein
MVKLLSGIVPRDEIVVFAVVFGVTTHAIAAGCAGLEQGAV